MIEQSMIGTMNRLVSLLPWWMSTLRAAIDTGRDTPRLIGDVDEPIQRAAAAAACEIWRRYRRFIPPDRASDFERHLVNALEDSIVSTPVLAELLRRRANPYFHGPCRN